MGACFLFRIPFLQLLLSHFADRQCDHILAADAGFHRSLIAKHDERDAFQCLAAAVNSGLGMNSVCDLHVPTVRGRVVNVHVEDACCMTRDSSIERFR